MERRGFVRSLLLAGAGAALPGGQVRAAAERRKMILPTDKPDRHHLKVMEWNPIPAPDPEAWELALGGLVAEPRRLNVKDLARIPRITQSSRLKCVQCWSGRVLWEGFRCADLLKLAHPRWESSWVRVDCADGYFDCVSVEDLIHPRTLFAVGMNGEPLTPEHGAPLRLVMPHKYGYRSSKLITKLTFVDTFCQGIVADAWPSYYSPTGAIEAGVDHPFDFGGEARNIKGGEILDY